MRSLRSVLVLSALLVATARAEEPAVFPDAVLKKAIEDTLWISDPTPADMLGLTSLSHDGRLSPNGVITDLTGLEHAVNLRSLSLPYHDFHSLSPLSRCANLEHLDLRACPVSDISPLAGMHRLSWLSLHKTRVSDVSPLAGLTSLSLLDLRGAPLSLDAYEIHIPQLLAEHPDITIWYDPYRPQPHTVTIAGSTGGTVTCPGKGIFLYDHGQSVCLEAHASPGFVFLGWSGADDSTQNPWCFSVVRDSEIRANFASVLEKLYVDDDATPGPNDPGPSDPDPDGTAAHPFHSIQQAVDVARPGARVIVRPGTYFETIDLLGKSIEVTGLDESEPNIVPLPVIDGGGKDTVVKCTRGEDPNCVLRGLVITGGKGQQAGGILCTRSSPTVRNCLIVGNRAMDADGGGGIHCRASSARFVNCTVSGNCGGSTGAGVCFSESRATLLNSIAWENLPSQIRLFGSGDSVVAYTAVAGGWPGPGNLDVDPLFALGGYWANPADITKALPATDPVAVWTGGDYHPLSEAGRWDPLRKAWIKDPVTSPCIDAGDRSTPIGREVSPNGGRVDLGAYGGTNQASMSPGEG